MSNTLTFKISIPTQNGFFGRECNNSDCKRYFKIHQNSLKDEMFCPYCGLLFKKDELCTKDQLNYATENAKEEAMEYISKEFSNMLAKTFEKQTKINYKPGTPYRKKYI